MRQGDDNTFQSLYRKEKGNKPDQEELFFLSYLNSSIAITNTKKWQEQYQIEINEKLEREKKAKLKAIKEKEKERGGEGQPQEPFVISMFDTVIEQLNRMPFYVETNFQAVLDECRLMKNSEEMEALHIQIQNIASEQHWQKKRFLQDIEKTEKYELFHHRILNNAPLSKSEKIFFQVLCVSNLIDRFILPTGSINKSDEFAKKQLAELSYAGQLNADQFLRIVRYAEHLAVSLLESSKHDDQEKIATHLFTFIKLIKLLKATFLKQGVVGDIEKSCDELNKIIDTLNKKNKLYDHVNLQGISKSGIYKGRKLLEEAKVIFAQKILNNGDLIHYTGTLRQWMYLQIKPTQESVIGEAALLVKTSRDELLQCNDKEGRERLRQIFCYRYQLFCADYGEINISETLKKCYQENKKKLIKSKYVKSSIKKQENAEWVRHKKRLKVQKNDYHPTLSPMALASQCWMLNYFTVLRDKCKPYLAQKMDEAQQNQEVYSDRLALISNQDMLANVVNLQRDMINPICMYLDQMMVNASTQIRMPGTKVNSQGFNLAASFSKNCPHEKKIIEGLIDQDNQYNDSVLGAFFHFLFHKFEYLSVNEKIKINEVLTRKSNEGKYLLPFHFKLGFDDEQKKTCCYYRRETGVWEKFSGDQQDIIFKLAEINQSYFQIKDSINALKDFFSDIESLHYEKKITPSQQRSLETAISLLNDFDRLKNSIAIRTVAYNRVCDQAVNDLKDWFNAAVLSVIRKETSSNNNVIAKHIVGSPAYPYMSKMAKALKQETQLQQSITKISIKDYLERIYDQSYFRQGWGVDADLLIRHLEFYRDYATDDVSRVNIKSKNRYDVLTEKQALDYLIKIARGESVLKKGDAAVFNQYLDAVAVIIKSNDENTIRRWANDHLFQEVFFHVFEFEDNSFLMLLEEIDDDEKRKGLFEQKKVEVNAIHKNMLSVCQAFLDESPFFVNQQNRLSGRFKTPFENQIKYHRYEDILFYLNRLLDKDYNTDKLNEALEAYVKHYDGNDICSYSAIVISWYEKTNCTSEQKNKLVSDYMIKRISSLIQREALGTVNYQPEQEPLFTWLVSMQDQSTQSSILDLVGDGLIQLAQSKGFSLEYYGVLPRCVDVGFLASDNFLFKNISEKLASYFYRRRAEIAESGFTAKFALKKALIEKKLTVRDTLEKEKRQLKRNQKQQIKEKKISIENVEKEIAELKSDSVTLKNAISHHKELYAVIDSQLTQLASIASHQVAADVFYEKTFLYVDRETAKDKFQNWADEIPPKSRRISKEYVSRLIVNCVEKNFRLSRCPIDVCLLPEDFNQDGNVPPSLSEQRLTLLIENCIDYSTTSVNELISLFVQLKSNNTFSPSLYCLVNKLIMRANDEKNIGEGEKKISGDTKLQLEGILSELNTRFFYYYLDKPKQFNSDWLHYPESLYQCMSSWQNHIINNPNYREPLINACLPPDSNSHYDFDRFIFSLNSKSKSHCKKGRHSMFGRLVEKFEQKLYSYSKNYKKLSNEKLVSTLRNGRLESKFELFNEQHRSDKIEDIDHLVKSYKDKLISVAKGESDDGELSEFSDLTLQLVEQIESIWFSNEGIIGDDDVSLINSLLDLIALKNKTRNNGYFGELNKSDLQNKLTNINESIAKRDKPQSDTIKFQIEADKYLIKFKNEIKNLFCNKADDMSELNLTKHNLLASFKARLSESVDTDSSKATLFDFSYNEISELLRIVALSSELAKELIDNLDDEIIARKANLSDHACQLAMLNWWRNIIMQVSGWACVENSDTRKHDYKYNDYNRSSNYIHRQHDLYSRYADYVKLKVDFSESVDSLNNAIIKLTKLEFIEKPTAEFSLKMFNQYFGSVSSNEKCQILYGYASKIVSSTQTLMLSEYADLFKKAFDECVVFDMDKPEITSLSSAVCFLENNKNDDVLKNKFFNKLRFIQDIYSKFTDMEQIALDKLDVFNDFKNIKSIQASLQAAHKAKRKTTVQKESGLAYLIKEADNLDKRWPSCKEALAKLISDIFQLIANSDDRHQSAFFVDLINSIYACFPKGAHEKLVFQRFVLEQLINNHSKQEIRAFFDAFVSPCKSSDSTFKDFLAKGDLLRDCTAVELKLKLQHYIAVLSPQADSFLVLAELERHYYSRLRGEHFQEIDIINDINSVLEKYKTCINNSIHEDNVLVHYVYHFLINEPIPKDRLDYLSDATTTSSSLSSYLSGDEEARNEILFSSSSDSDPDSDSGSSSGSSHSLPVVSKAVEQKEERSWFGGFFSLSTKPSAPGPIKKDLLTNLACLRQSKIVDYFTERGTATSASLMIDSLQPIVSESIKTYMLSKNAENSKAILQELFSVVDMFDGGRSLSSSRALLSSCLLSFFYLSASDKKRHERIQFFNNLALKLSPELQSVMPKLFFDHFVIEFYKDDTSSLSTFALTKEKMSQLILDQKKRLPKINTFIKDKDNKDYVLINTTMLATFNELSQNINDAIKSSPSDAIKSSPSNDESLAEFQSRSVISILKAFFKLQTYLKIAHKNYRYCDEFYEMYEEMLPRFNFLQSLYGDVFSFGCCQTSDELSQKLIKLSDTPLPDFVELDLPCSASSDSLGSQGEPEKNKASFFQFEKPTTQKQPDFLGEHRR